ncbi:hypothetical protein [Pseudomonas sp. FW300-N2F2]|uniref:hypothetical protein n=1 Tax=Pseudomonas sp. FW300-N2F2 TaxID=2751320 RepID=UPI001A9306D0|nr:hypothetical protein [Pseudomonas sp. FW300-N2F2]
MATKFFPRFGIFEFISLIIGVLGVAVTIYQATNSEKMSLQVRMESSISLLQEDPILKDELQIFYRGEPVSGISRLDFLIVNNGEKPISASEIVLAPTIYFDSGSKVLSAKITSMDPPDINAKLIILGDDNAVRIDPNLLNPTDYVRMSIYLRNPPAVLPRVQARITGLKKVDFTDARPEKNPVKKEVSWLVYPVGVIMGVFLLFLFPMFRESSQHRRLRSRLTSNNNLVKELSSSDDFQSFITQNMAFAINSEKSTMMSLLESYAAEGSDDNKRRLVASIERVAMETGGAEILFYICPFVLGASGFYIYYQLFL